MPSILALRASLARLSLGSRSNVFPALHPSYNLTFGLSFLCQGDSSDIVSVNNDNDDDDGDDDNGVEENAGESTDTSGDYYSCKLCHTCLFSSSSVILRP